MYKFFVIGLLVAAAAAAPNAASQELDCLQSDDLLSCLAVKTVRTINRAARSTEVQIFEGVTFVRDTPLERSAKSLESETQLMNELPRDLADRTLKLMSMIYESALSFFKSHSLKLNAPEGSVSRALVEGRQKLKKYIPLIFGAAGLKLLGLAPLVLGGLVLLTLKALFVGKIALLVAGILAFQKLFASGGALGASNLFNKHSTGSGWTDGANQGWSSSSNGQAQGYYKRSFEQQQDAHSLAYSAHAPDATHTE